MRRLTDVIEDIGFGLAQIWQLLITGGVFASEGADLILIGSVTGAISKEWHLGATQRGMIVSILFLGVLCGNVGSGSLGDTIGRRWPLLISFLGIFVFSLASAFATSFLWMVLIRFLVGLAFGIGQPAQNALGMEIVPAERRVHATCVGCLSFCAGQVYSALIIWIDDPGMKHLDWRWVITMGAIPWVILWLIAYFTIYESPAFLAVRGEHEKARDVLSQMRKLNGRPEVAIDFEPPQAVTRQSISTEVLPEIKSHLSPAINLMLWTLFEIPGYVLTVVLGLYFLRKTCIIISQLGLVISVLSFVWAAHLVNQRLNLAIAEVVLQLGFYSFKAFVCINYVTVRTYSGEVYPTVARTMGTALCIGAGRLGSITCPFIYEWLVDFTGSFNAFFYVLAGLNIGNAILICLLPYETKGKALKDHADEIEPLKA